MNNTSPKVSIVIPVYNNEKYLKKCVSSVLSSTLTDIEVILVDDGSTDSSPIICDEFADTDKRIVVIHQDNQGVSVARNTGISKATGTWLAFVDSDDYVYPDYYQDLTNVAEDNNVDIIRTLHYVQKGEELSVHSSMRNYAKLDVKHCKQAIGGGVFD